MIARADESRGPHALVHFRSRIPAAKSFLRECSLTSFLTAEERSKLHDAPRELSVESSSSFRDHECGSRSFSGSIKGGKKSTRRTVAEWSKILARCRRGGESQSVFCGHHGVSLATLRYQLTKARSEAPAEVVPATLLSCR